MVVRDAQKMRPAGLVIHGQCLIPTVVVMHQKTVWRRTENSLRHATTSRLLDRVIRSLSRTEEPRVAVVAIDTPARLIGMLHGCVSDFLKNTAVFWGEPSFERMENRLDTSFSENEAMRGAKLFDDTCKRCAQTIFEEQNGREGAEADGESRQSVLRDTGNLLAARCAPLPLDLILRDDCLKYGDVFHDAGVVRVGALECAVAVGTVRKCHAHRAINPRWLHTTVTDVARLRTA